MWTVLKKELREGWLFLVVNILVLVGTPPLGRLCLPRQWDDDVTSIFIAVMFGVFVPLYLVILAAGLVQDENTFLVRGLPVKPWKVAGGKLLYLALNFILLEGLCIPFIVGLLVLPDWISSELVFHYLWIGATGVAALTAFAFASFLPRKSYAIFAALLATILGMGTLVYLTSLYPTVVATDLTVPLFLGIVLLLLIVGAVMLYHDLIRQPRRRWIRAATVALLLPAVSGVLWLRSPYWMKQTVLGFSHNLQPAADGLFITSKVGPSEEYYLFDVGSGDLRSIPFISNAEYIVDTDPGRNTVYTATVKTFVRGGKELGKPRAPAPARDGDQRRKSPADESKLRKYSALNPVTGKTRDLGLLPAVSVSFEGDIARWTHSEDMNRTFGFKDLARGTAFEFNDTGCQSTAWGKDGVLYDSSGPEGPVWNFVDFAEGRSREVFKGQYFSWPWKVGSGYFLYEGPRDFSKGFPYDRDIIRWDPGTGIMQKLGSGRPILAHTNLIVLFRGKDDGPKTLVLLRDGKEVSTLSTDYFGGYPIGYYQYPSAMELGSPWKYVFYKDANWQSKVLGVLTIESDRLKLKTLPLPSNLDNLLPIPGSGDLLLFVKNTKDTPNWDAALCRVYRMDPATGKMRRLV